MNPDELKGKKIAVVGLGVNNRFLAEFFRKNNISFDVIEKWRDQDELSEKIQNYQVIFRTPGLPYLSKAIQHAKSKGVEVSSQTKLFFDMCPAPIIGVTGTKGKGTTATLISRILERSGKRIWLAGNIGRDPFEFIGELKPEDVVVLELSSFQLQDLHKSPHIAVVLRTTSEHLDHHRDRAEYIEAKKNIIRHQTEDDFAVLNYDDPVARSFAAETPANIFWASTEQAIKPGCFAKDEKIFVNDGKGEIDLMSVSDVRLRGRFNLENVTAAVAAASAAGFDNVIETRNVIKEFKGLEHRLEFAREVSGVKFYNDSFSTTPETAIAAVSAFEEPIILIIGGSEKKSDYSKLADKIADSKVKAIVAAGITGPKIAGLARKAGYQGKIIDNHPKDMQEIVGMANDCAEPGDVVLLSPASASLDMFADYKHRGELFKKFVNKL